MREIWNLTNCKKPCHYNEYTLVRKFTKSSSKLGQEQCYLGIWVISPDTTVQAEVLLYPWTSLVAEFGGTLSLFLGFSFMTLWEGVQTAVKAWTWIGQMWANLKISS